MTTEQICKSYISFFKQKGHKEVPNVSLVPEGDSTLLFVNSGMFPLVPYLSGEPHPLGKRLVNVQRSLRFEDIDEVGDNRHTTCFHMLGNWSLGDYFKEEQLNWIYEFFIEVLKLSPQRLFASVFKGDEYAPKDTQSIDILKKIFKKYGIDAEVGERIFAYGRKDNWWQRGESIGELGGPDSEIFYYLGPGSGVGKNPAEYPDLFLEIGNSVFMQYKKTETGWGQLPQKNVDFGAGLERIALVLQQKTDIFQTDSFLPIIEAIEKASFKQYLLDSKTTRIMRILADHSRAAVLLAMDGVYPSNKDQGYVLRRYIRRIVRFSNLLTGNGTVLIDSLVEKTADSLSWLYPNLVEKQRFIKTLFKEEAEKFEKTLKNATNQVQKILKTSDLSCKFLAKKAFDVYQSTGFPPEMFFDEVKDRGIKIKKSEFESLYKKFFQQHQKISRKGAEKKFKGGLLDKSRRVVKYHTATHLLHAALRKLFGSHIKQKGSNITRERLRFDFSHPKKLSLDEIKKVEDLVNQKIREKLPVNFVILPYEEAVKTKALHFFGQKYGEKVKVYYIGESLDKAFSKEFCGGPHVKNLSELKGVFKIYKQEMISKGVLRVYAKLV